MWAVALLYFGGIFLVFCICGALSEMFLFRNDRDKE